MADADRQYMHRRPYFGTANLKSLIGKNHPRVPVAGQFIPNQGGKPHILVGSSLLVLQFRSDSQDHLGHTSDASRGL